MLGLLGIGFTMVKDWLGNKQKMQAAEADNRQRLMADTENNNHEWEMASLSDKDKWLRRISFAMFSGPFIWALFDPTAVSAYFDTALASMPEWYVQSYLGMTGGIWGISSLKNAVPGLVGGVVKAIKGG